MTPELADWLRHSTPPEAEPEEHEACPYCEALEGEAHQEPCPIFTEE